MNSIGSIWQKWDLHIHTPASFQWTGGQIFGPLGSEESDAVCKTIIDRINAIDVHAFCVMDYWHFDGYLAIRDYLSRNPNVTTKRIFPGVELRMAAPTNFRLNTHVLFSDDVLPEALSTFISHLKFADYGEKPATRQSFIDLGRSYEPGKLQLYGCTPADKSDDEKMLLVGYKSALVTRESVLAAIKVVGAEQCIVIQPYDTNDGLDELDWKCHPFTDSYLMQWADCFETRNPVHVDLFLGKGHKTKPHVGPQFIENLGGFSKPVFSGSDAHSISKYGDFPSNRATWLKAQTTFKGLRQVCYEPTLRCYIGPRPPKLIHVEQNKTKYISSLALAKQAGSTLTEHWFDGVSIQLNPGLIAIIGNKGSGKSALADILALAGNSHCAKMEFLNDKRFRSAGNKAKHFDAVLTWMDGSSAERSLDQNADRLQPERIRYLPQHFIEDLCNEIATGNETNFEKELRKVIFSHVPPEEQLRLGTLDELLDFLVGARKRAIQQLQTSLRALNDTIVRSEVEMSEDTLKTYTTSLELKQKELEAHLANPIPVVDKPQEDADDETTQQTIKAIDAKQKELSALRTQLSALKTERTELVAQNATVVRLLGHIDNFQALYDTFIDEHNGEFDAAEFNLDEIIKMTIDRKPLNDVSKVATERLSEIAVLIAGKPADDDNPAVPGLEERERDAATAIAKLQETLKAPEKAYQTYQIALGLWNARKTAIQGTVETPETIEYFKDRINRSKEIIPQELDALREQRRELVRSIHAEILAIRSIYEKLYAPVQKIASAAATSTDSIQLEFDAYLSTIGFEDNFLDFIRKNRKGSFYGEDESKKAVENLIQAHDFNSTDSVVEFTDAVMRDLTSYDREGTREKVTIESQLRQSKKATDLYDFLFGLSYMDIRYTLRLGGKDISQLSPGEKGALLLVFYLLLDTEEIPIIIDQPEHNLDNESVVRLLVDCIRRARDRRQVLIVTHNPNLAVFCDADQVICCKIDKTDGNRIIYTTGAIEDYVINKTTVDVLEGTYPAFDNRRKKYQKPQPQLQLAVSAADSLPT